MHSVNDSKAAANNPADSVAEADEAASSSECSEACVPRVAFRCDGRVLISITDLEGVDLSKRETWIGVVLTQAEASNVLKRIDFEEAAAPTVARLRALDKKAKAAKDDDDSNSNDE